MSRKADTMKRKFLFMTAIILTATVFNSFSVFAAGWQQDRVGWWYSKNSGGYYRNEWLLDNNSGLYYYFDNAGYMVSGRWIGNYYLGKDGAMITNAVTPDGYYVGTDGAWIPDTLNLSGFRGEVLLYMHATDKYTKVTENTWKVLGEWSRIDVDGGATFFSTQDLTVNEHTKYVTVEEGTAAEIPISRGSFERYLTDRSLRYEGFKLELNNKTVVKAYVYQ